MARRRAKRRKPKQSYAELQASISKRSTAKEFVDNLSEDLYAMRPGSNLRDALAEISSCLNSVSVLRND